MQFRQVQINSFDLHEILNTPYTYVVAPDEAALVILRHERLGQVVDDLAFDHGTHLIVLAQQPLDFSAPEAELGHDVKPDELAELPRVVGGEDVGKMKFNLLPVGIGDGVLVFHWCLQTLSLLFLQEAIEDGVGSLELRVRENVYGHGRQKPALNRCFSGHIRIAAVHVTTFRPDVHEIAFQDFCDLLGLLRSSAIFCDLLRGVRMYV